MGGNLKKARDRNGAYEVDWSMLREAENIPQQIEFIPFSKGDARVMSVPAQDMMFSGVGKGATLAYGVIALRLGDTSVHHALSSAQMRQFAALMAKAADMIDG